MSVPLNRLVLTLLLGVLPAAALAHGHFHVHAVVPSGDPPYSELMDALRAHAGPGLKITDGGLDDDAGAADIILTIGVEAAMRWVPRDHPRPVVSVMLPAASWWSLQAGSHGHPRTAVFLDQPPQRQFALVRAVLPPARDVGAVFGPLSVHDEPDWQASARQAGLRLHAAIPVPADNPLPAVASVLRRSDVLLVIPDPAVINQLTVRGVLLTSFRARRPVFGFSKSLVSAGAIAAVYSTPQQIGSEAGELLLNWHESSGELPSPRFPKQYSLAVNRQVAFALNIVLPPDEILLERLRMWGGEGVTHEVDRNQPPDP